jgi:hypothetical protein
LQLGAYPNIAKGLWGIFIHDPAVLWTLGRDDRWDFSSRVGACRVLNAPLDSVQRGP